jgi:hypothetical protein
MMGQCDTTGQYSPVDECIIVVKGQKKHITCYLVKFTTIMEQWMGE